jgi:hypothetical protein
VGIQIPTLDLERELEAALVDAASDSGSELWMDRITWLSEQVDEGYGKTYVAALGAALLAKATNSEVDSLTQAPKAGPRGYSLRSVAEFLQERVRGRVHLGTLSKNPVNNSPFLRGPARIDRIDKIHPSTRAIFDAFVRWLDELNGYDQVKAHDALVAFLHHRMHVQQARDEVSAARPELGVAASLEDLLEALHLFATEDPEGGSRGQAIVAAVLSCAFPDVEVVPNNHPAPFDVKRTGSPSPLVCEVKQQAIRPEDVSELARRAAEHSTQRAIYAALDPLQPALPVDRLCADALCDHGVLLDVCYDIRELVARIGVYSDADMTSFLADLPSYAAQRCEPSGVGERGQRRLDALLRGVSQRP